jgi:hypothetical protein
MNGDQSLGQAIELEMKCIRSAFELTDNGVMLKFHKYVGCHMIFDVEMILTRTASLVAKGHQIDCVAWL